MKKFLAILISLVLVLLCGCYPQQPSLEENKLYVYFIDVGQADCTLISLNNKNMLIDGGNADDGAAVIRFIKSLGITTLDTVVASHAHEDHIGGLSAIIDAFNVNTVYCPVDEYNSIYFDEFKDAAERQCGITLCKSGLSWSHDRATVNVLWPHDVSGLDTNNTSIVLKLTFGKTSFLFTGDLEQVAESKIAEGDIRANVLKVGHHGSNTSTSYYFLRSVMPQLAIISCGIDNSYGHPHKETVERLNQAAVKTLRTDEEGTVTIVSDGDRFYYDTQKGDVVEYFDAVMPTLAPDSAYIGNKNSKKFHFPHCSGLPAEKNSVKFFSRQQALVEGYSPCGICKP